PAVGMDNGGNFVLTWSSHEQDGSGWGVYAQRYDAAGVAQGSEFRVNTTTAGNQGSSSAAATTGAFVIVWSSNDQDGSGYGVYGQRYSNSGSVLLTTEAGGTDTFRVVLTSEPVADVTIGISTSNPNAGVPSVSSLTFTPADWNVPQTV